MSSRRASLVVRIFSARSSNVNNNIATTIIGIPKLLSLERYLVRHYDVYGPVQLRRHDVTVLAGLLLVDF